MRINCIRLKDYRNIAEAVFTPSPGVNILYGGNAQGKTNILEAIWLFSGARSFRGTKDAGLIKLGSAVSRLELDFFAQEREQTASLSLSAGNKNASLNEIKLAGQSGFAGVFCVVLFSPDHLPLVKQGPENRRRMIDSSLCQAFPKYAGILESYKKILRQRASLLRDVAKNSSLYDLLDVWDKSLIDYGAYITAVRDGYIRRLSDNAREIYSGISGGREELAVSYSTGLSRGEGPVTRSGYAALLAKAVREARPDDIASGSTSVGPHRDDMEIAVNGMPARGFASQGQQRSCVLALKLAECGILEERNAEPPVILLDDVMSELDGERRHFLLNRLEGRQVIITCCDKSLFDGLDGGAVFRVENGSVRTG